jgi:uncharacterized membrane protein
MVMSRPSQVILPLSAKTSVSFTGSGLDAVVAGPIAGSWTGMLASLFSAKTTEPITLMGQTMMSTARRKLFDHVGMDVSYNQILWMTT